MLAPRQRHPPEHPRAPRRLLRAARVHRGSARGGAPGTGLRSVRHARPTSGGDGARRPVPRDAVRARSLRQARDPRSGLRNVERRHHAARGAPERVLQAVGTAHRGGRSVVPGGSPPLRRAGARVLRSRASAVRQRLARADAGGRLWHVVRLHGAVHTRMERQRAKPVLRGQRGARVRPVKEIENKVALVTGGGSGIGRAIALRFARAAGRVAVLDVAEPAARDVAREIAACGSEGLAVPCDVSRQAEVRRAFEAVAERFGPADILVNSAGIAHVGTVEQTSEDDLDRLYAVNVKGVYNCMRAAVLQMKGRGGVILNIASVASTVGIPDRFAYSMTKGAVLTMTYSVARDYVADRNRCNAIAPERGHHTVVGGRRSKAHT